MLQIKDICKQYKTGNFVQRALDHVSLNLRENEFVAILGPSGSGKTTLLNIIGGLDRYDSGDLVINGISTKKYKDRDWDSYRNHTIGFVFQSYNLIPHQTVLANVELALTISGVSKRERRKRAIKALQEVGLGEQLHKKPNQMSGGQMQRVAIARALVNNPDILLADEPTGALDSETSVQVMELLKRVAKDRLVVMVTHNPDLAKQYATRIVNLKDGTIRSDTDPFTADGSNLSAPVHKNMGRSSMSRLTSLALSFNNLRTKKARTLLTSFAGSIGIIGIALILSISNGVNDYIADIEENTLSEYPIQIQSAGIDMSSMLFAAGQTSGEEEDGDADEVKVARTITGMFSQVNSNDLASLKAWIDSGESGIEPYTNAIEYAFDVTPQIYRTDGEGVRQVHPDQSFSSLGLGSGSGSLMSSMMSTNVFYEMPRNESLYQDQYEVKAGRWPENEQECVLVLNSGGYMSDFLLYTLGLRDAEELDEMVEEFSQDEQVTAPEDIRNYSYDEILGITFKVVNSADYYEYDEEYAVWKDKSGDEDYMRELVENGEDLTIVGIVQPAEGESAAMLSAGICYLPELTDQVIAQAADSEIVKEQLAHKDTDVFTGDAFGAEDEDGEDEDGLDLSTLFEIDADALQAAFQIDADAMNLDLSSLGDLSSMDVSMPDLSSYLDMDSMPDFSEILKDIDFDMGATNAGTQTGTGGQTGESETGGASGTGSQTGTTGNAGTSSTDVTLQIDMTELLKEVQVNITGEQVKTLFQDLVAGYQTYAAAHPDADASKVEEGFQAYLTSEEVRNLILTEVTDLVRSGVTVSISYDQLLALGLEQLTDYQNYLEDNKIEESTNETILKYLSSADVQQQITSKAETLLKDSMTVNITSEQLQTVLKDVLSGYPAYAIANGYPQPEEIGDYFLEYLRTEEGQQILLNGISKMVDTSKMEEKIEQTIQAYVTRAVTEAVQTAVSSLTEQISAKVGEAVQTYMTEMMSQLSTGLQTAMGQTMNQVTAKLTSAMQQAMLQLSAGMEDALQIDPDAFADAMKMNMTEEDLAELMQSLLSSEDATYDGNLEKLGYADVDTPGEINIYPKDFQSKEEILNILDDYNARMEEAGEDDKVITYTDVVGTLMSSVTKIVNTISYVLVAFVAISLVVSSIMIGVITYISVLERRKEIGILRAIGASKRNISQVFNAETFIIGLCAGLMGIGLTLLALIPGNMIIHKVAESTSINAVLPPAAAVVLIALSVVLTTIGGLIPSKKAAKSDPVAALRSE